MGTSYGGLPVHSDGMILNLDAGNPASYPGSGSTVYDTSGNGIHGSILSSVSYNTNVPRFTFPTSTSTNSRIVMNHNNVLNYSYLNWCYSLWVRQLTDDNGGWAQLFIKGNDGGNRRPAVWFYSGQTSRFHVTWNHSSQGQQTLNTNDPFTTPINTWYNFVFQSRNGTMMTFRNGVQDSATTTITARTVNSDPLHIGHRGSYRSLNMDIAKFTVYNRSFTNQEVLDNFNAQKSRFGY